ncbi:MAG: hypothetical protein V3V62_00665 [bacterium]
MTFEVKKETVRFDAEVDDLKLVYRVLHRHLTENLDLMECAFFDALQSALHQKAQEEGVDIGHHTAWDLWLGHETPVTCEERLKGRRTFEA